MGSKLDTMNIKMQGVRMDSLHFYGRSDGIRTHDLLVPNQAHYQAVPHPEIDRIIIARLFGFVNTFFG